MNWIRQLGRRLWMLFRGRRFDADLDEEMRLHRELREQEQIERGLSPKEAHCAKAFRERPGAKRGESGRVEMELA